MTPCRTTRLNEGDHGCQLPLKLPGVDKQLMERAACTQPWYSVILRLAPKRLVVGECSNKYGGWPAVYDYASLTIGGNNNNKLLLLVVGVGGCCWWLWGYDKYPGVCLIHPGRAYSE